MPFGIIIIGYLVVHILLANYIDKQTQPKTQMALAYPYKFNESSRIAPEHHASTAPTGGYIIWQIMTLLLIASILLIAPLRLLDPTTTNPISSLLAILSVTVPIAAVATALLYSNSFGNWLARLFNKNGTFDPTSAVHQTAFILSLVILGFTVIDLIVNGGVAGLAEEIEQQGLGVIDALANMIAMPAIALLGIGILMRRSWKQSLERLNLRIPTFEDVVWGTAVAGGCLMLILIFAIIITQIIPPEKLAEQGAASDQIARAFADSLGLAFLAALSAAVGEEILFRGALQPVFGIVPTTLFFALLHAQYALTPASAIIIIVGGAMGWLKQRQSTTAAIIAHFIYNFVQFGIAYAYFQLEEAGLLPDITESFIHLTTTLIKGIF